MSGQLKLKAASLGGDITLTPTDTASNLVVTIPAGTSTLVTNATLPAQLNASGSAPIYACRAWVNFNGTGTVAIRASGNVSSITDNGTGDYTVNFTTAMPDANYATVSIGGYAELTANQATFYEYQTTKSTTATRILGTAGNTLSFTDFPLVNVIVMR
jgi:hypothetical protein